MSPLAVVFTESAVLAAPTASVAAALDSNGVPGTSAVSVKTPSTDVAAAVTMGPTSASALIASISVV